jgi:hypothetical protein
MPIKSIFMMKKPILGFIVLLTILSACSAVQSVIRSSFPYTANLIVPQTTQVDTVLSVKSQASTLDQIVTGYGSNTKAIKDVRIASVKIEANTPAGQSLGLFKSIKVYISRGDSSKELLIASRNEISTNVGSSILLDADNTALVDEFIKGSTVRIRMEYELRNSIINAISIKSTLALSVASNKVK